MLFDFTDDNNFKLKANEYIKIVAIKPQTEDKKGYTKTFYVQDINEFLQTVKKYKYVCNIYIGLSTYLDKKGQKDSVHARKVMFLDFDKKDYPQYEDVKDFTNHVKRRIPYLFNHAIVSSGNGFHFYIATQKTIDVTRAVKINKLLATILGADLKAVSPTQLVRLPTTLNLKQESKQVNIICNNYGHNKFKPYTLNKLERILSFENQAEETKTIEPLAPQHFNKTSSYYCIEKMLANGCQKGERNFCLGRITKFLQEIKGFRYDNALMKVQEWNRRCNPPKTGEEIQADFDRYWKSDYKLLGCNLSNVADRVVLEKYCNKFNCTTIYQEAEENTISTLEVKMDNHLLKANVIKKLRGNHYLILSVLHIHPEGLTIGGLKEQLTNGKTQKCCLSKNTLKTVVGDLLGTYIQRDKYGIYTLCDISNFGLGYTRYYYSATILLINGIIKQQDYRVYLCLVRNLQQKRSVTYDAIAEDTDIDPANISRHMTNLAKSKILLIEKGYNEKGVLYNSYKLVA